jgi:ABC-type uncharacterized transport system substrate-binding protein
LLRLNDPTTPAEPSRKDIERGLVQSGVSPSALKIVELDAKGDRAALPGLIDAAIAEGAELLMPLGAEASLAVAAKAPKIPVVFAMTGEPARLGLARDVKDHDPNMTGVFTASRQSLLVPIARGSLKSAKVFGILFHPDNPLSVAHKEALLIDDWQDVKPVTAEYHADSEIPAAIKALADQKAEVIFLTHGIGKGARDAVKAAREAKIPVFGFLVDHGKAGAIFCRATIPIWTGFEAGRRAGRVLKGESPKEIPLGPGDNYQTIINPDEAKSLKVTILPAILRDPTVVKSE